ncbi:LOW QUALITY PROTEIN: hypothetical protein ACHAW6_006199, partial [Cyclotella cf. meneghiniana]
ELLEKRLNAKGFAQSRFTPGLWTHESKPIQFTLVYVGKESAQFLGDALKENYTISVDWEGEKYVGLKLDWDYDKRKVPLSMPGYVSIKAIWP